MYDYNSTDGGLDTGGFLGGLLSVAGQAGSVYQQFHPPNGVATPPPGPPPVARPAASGFSPWAIVAAALALVGVLFLALRRN